MEEKDTYSLETVINTLKGKDVKTQLHILFDTIDSLKEDRRIIEDKYKVSIVILLKQNHFFKPKQDE